MVEIMFKKFFTFILAAIIWLCDHAFLIAAISFLIDGAVDDDRLVSIEGLVFYMLHYLQRIEQKGLK